MVDLTALSETVLARLRAKHEAREAALEASRRSIRASANAIRAAHRNDRVTASALLTDSEAALDQPASRAPASQRWSTPVSCTTPRRSTPRRGRRSR